MPNPDAVLVRVGSMGEVWACRNAERLCVVRGQRVVCRTPRGVELGDVLAESGEQTGPNGEILRMATIQDELLDSRLRRYKNQAVHNCQLEICRQGLSASLMEVDHLLDGKTLVFYFLGELTPDLQQLANSLVDAYEEKVRSRHFAKLLADGCGPACGTAEGGGCGTSGGCAICVLATACDKTKLD